jgi:hypothetical protein
MRHLLSCILLFGIACECHAQSAKFEKVRIGFKSYAAEDSGRTKIGLWTPLYVDLQAGPDGLRESQLKVEIPDNEDVGTIISVALPRLDKNARRAGEQAVITYGKPLRGSVKFKLENAEGSASHSLEAAPLELGARVYLTLGGKLPDLPAALAVLSPHGQDGADPAQPVMHSLPRYACHEDSVALLPTLSFAYDGVDLVFLSTTNREFLLKLQSKDAAALARLKALGQWVRRGGRLVIPVAADSQAVVRGLLESPAWTPPLPVQLPEKPRPMPRAADPNFEPSVSLADVTNWAGPNKHEFQAVGAQRHNLADLGEKSLNPFWDVLAELPRDAEMQRTWAARVPYGLGSVTFLAFDLEREPFASFRGKKELLSEIIKQLEPGGAQQAKPGAGPGFGRPDREGDDLATLLQRSLDTFDVPVISFGWVALFIVIYILIIGPLDYLLLKKVFKKLEWTWITFPAVVLTVSIAAYFTAYALKGKDLKINKVDLVDFDLRTEADANGKTRQAQAYGHTWFTILSPRIQNYTIGIEPALTDWGLAQTAKMPPSADVVEWLGRPEPDGPGSYGRTRSTFLRRPYEYADEAKGLQRVPIPVWTSKTFHAAWDLQCTKLPFEADLVYHLGGEVKIAGTLQSNLPAPLTDVWLFYHNRCFRLPDVQPGKKHDIDMRSDQTIQSWASPREGGPETSGGTYDPTPHVKWFLFQEKIDNADNFRNHAFSPLDLSWRFKDEKKSPLREVILFGRLARQQGPAEELAKAHAAPTALWLGNLPADAPKEGRPALEGTIVQDTYIRAIIPVRQRS